MLKLSKDSHFLPLQEMYLHSFKNKLVTTCDTSSRLIWITLTLACQRSQRICQSYLLENQNTPISVSCHKTWYIKIYLTYLSLREEFYENISLI